MKFNILKALIPAVAVLSVTSCSDWTTPEPKEFDYLFPYPVLLSITSISH